MQKCNEYSKTKKYYKIHEWCRLKSLKVGNKFLNIYKISIGYYTTIKVSRNYNQAIKYLDNSYIGRLIKYTMYIKKEMRLDMKFMPVYKPIVYFCSLSKNHSWTCY